MYVSRATQFRMYELMAWSLMWPLVMYAHVCACTFVGDTHVCVPSSTMCVNTQANNAQANNVHEYTLLVCVRLHYCDTCSLSVAHKHTNTQQTSRPCIMPILQTLFDTLLPPRTNETFGGASSAIVDGRHGRPHLTPVAGLIFKTKNRAIFLERFFGREITAREQLSRAVILARF